MKTDYPWLDLSVQQKAFLDIVLSSDPIREILDNALQLELPNWYLGAGCLCQAVWNYLTGRPLGSQIGDYDLVYFDPDDLSKETELVRQHRVSELFAEIPSEVEAINEARVHLWYEQDYGKKISAYSSTEDAITCWPTTSTCVGITKMGNNYKVFAPYGLHDLLSMTVKPNRKQVTPEGYLAKCQKWKAKWPELTILEW